MSTVTLDELLAVIPDGKLIPVQGSHPAVILPEKDFFFLAPSLRLIRGSVAGHSSAFIVISAPGAVGKTALARSIASSKGICLWDLGRLKLGDNSFKGTIADCFGSGNLANILVAIQAGDFGFVLDAFDEAEILSGWQQIESFLDELIKSTSGASKPCLVLLARSETAFLVSFYLEDKGIDCLQLEIDYFNETQSKEFIGLQLEKLAKERRRPEIASRYRQHKGPFYSAVEAFFSTIYAAFSVESKKEWQEHSIQSFLGYAPVLQAISTYLSEFTNYVEVVNLIRQGQFTKDGADTTSNIMQDLLRREQEKVIGALKNKAIPGLQSFAGWQELYSPEEQLIRILCHALGDLDANDFGAFQAPPPLSVHYQTAIKSFLPQHPFVQGTDFSGPAFRDFTFGSLLKSSNSEVRILTREMMQQPKYVATPLLIRFYCADGTNLIHGEDAGFFYESATSRDTVSNLATVILLLPPSMSDTKNHVLDFLREDAPSGEFDLPTLYIRPSKNLEIVFNRRLRNGLIYFDGQVTLGHPGNDFEIADSEIACTTIKINSKTFIAQSSFAAESVVIRADNYAQLLPMVDPQVRGPGSLSVAWPSSNQYPWASFSKPS